MNKKLKSTFNIELWKFWNEI